MRFLFRLIKLVISLVLIAALAYAAWWVISGNPVDKLKDGLKDGATELIDAGAEKLKEEVRR